MAPPNPLVSLVAGATIVLLTGTAFASGTDCFPSDMGRTPSDPAEASLWRKAIEVAGIAPGACGIALRPWPHERDAYVLYAESPVEYNVVDHQLFLLRKKADSFEVVARHRTAGNPYVFQSFDFAAYTLRKGETAIGVRLRQRGPTIGGGWECIRLVLFARAKDELIPVFSATADESAEGNEVAYDIDTHFETSASATFIIGKPDRSGYNRIVRKSGKHKEVFSWDTTGYVAAGGQEPGCLADRCYCQDEYK